MNTPRNTPERPAQWTFLDHVANEMPNDEQWELVLQALEAAQWLDPEIKGAYASSRYANVAVIPAEVVQRVKDLSETGPLTFRLALEPRQTRRAISKIISVMKALENRLIIVNSTIDKLVNGIDQLKRVQAEHESVIAKGPLTLADLKRLYNLTTKTLINEGTHLTEANHSPLEVQRQRLDDEPIPLGGLTAYLPWKAKHDDIAFMEQAESSPFVQQQLQTYRSLLSIQSQIDELARRLAFARKTEHTIRSDLAKY
ncbi:MAG: hypothetical protein HY817_02060 [Candidatus Abawacabacteria bacterium]|nr:hypothetical protein [Candidatus Abawacabacteria bacterium]